MMGLISSLKYITGHPLNKNQRWSAIMRFLKWQLNVRINPYPVIYPFTNKSKLLVKRGWTGATGNLYCGLHEFEEMAFLLHFLRPDDTFVDIGANIGSYTVLASGHVGAKTIAFEPVPHTFHILRQNVYINQINELVQLHNIALASESGSIKFVHTEDTMNHAAIQTDHDTIEVPTETLDHILQDTNARLLKIDVEGFETEVLKGATNTLKNKSLNAIIIELNGSGKRYGFDEEEIHLRLLEAGFRPFRYEPFTRKLSSLSHFGSHNTIYIRDLEFVSTHLQSGSFIMINGHRF